MRRLREQKFRFVGIESTSYASQALFRSLNFEPVHEFAYDSFEFDGSRPFQGVHTARGPERACVLFEMHL